MPRKSAGNAKKDELSVSGSFGRPEVFRPCFLYPPKRSDPKGAGMMGRVLKRAGTGLPSAESVAINNFCIQKQRLLRSGS